MNADLIQKAERLLAQQTELRNAVDALDAKVQAWIHQIHTPLTPPEPPPLPKTIPSVPPPKHAPQISPPPLPLSPASSRDQFEFRLGSVWMVRIGILLLLTGLVFLGNHAFQFLALHANPLTRLLLLIASSLGLLGIGHRFETHPQKLRQFGQVLSAGGAAALYYCAYAAHAVPALCVIPEKGLGQLLLLGTAAGLFLFAVRKDSEQLAVLTVALSSYTSGLNPVGWPQVFLATISVLLLVRKQWPGVVVAAIPSTFLSLGWAQQDWPQYPSSVHAFWAMAWPILACWSIFTAGCFLSTQPNSRWRVPAFTANNAFLLALLAPGAAAAFTRGGALFALVLGLILIGLYSFVRKHRGTMGSLDSACLAQGVLSLTTALALFFGRHHCTLVLALEAAALTELSLFSDQKRVLKAGAILAALWGVLSGLQHLDSASTGSVLIPAALALLITAWRYKQAHGLRNPARWNRFAALLTTCALILVARFLNAICSQIESSDLFPALLSVLTLVLVVTLPAHRLPELAALSLGYLMIGIGLLFPSLWASTTHGLLPVLCVTASTLLFPAAFRFQRTWLLPAQRTETFSMIPTLLLTLFLHFWIPRFFPQIQTGTVLLAAESIFALAGILSGTHWAGRLSLSFAASGIVNLAIACWATPHSMGTLPSPVPLTLGVTLQALIAGIAAVKTPNIFPSGLLFFRAQLGAATLLGLLWCLFFLKPGLPLLGLTFLGCTVFVWALRKQHRNGLAFAAGIFLSAFGAISCRALALGFAREMLPCGIVGRCMTEWIHAYLTPANWIAALLLLGCQQFARKCSQPVSVLPPAGHRILMLAGLGMLWWNSHHLVASCHLRVWITVVWSITGAAILGAGFALHETFYRRYGLLLLALSIARAFLVDVWRFDTLYRILSFLVLGGLLILFSFVYNRLASREPQPGQALGNQAS
jgi:uncharacterized membrane protein